MKKIVVSIALSLLTLTNVYAVDFFSTERPESFFNFGARVGLNTSNRTINTPMGGIWNLNSWGMGFDAGVVADINFVDFISLQPGFFYESRSGSYTYQYSYIKVEGADPSIETQIGKGREYNFTIPVLASFHFNILEDLRWNVDFGPYFQFKLKSTFDGKFRYPESYSPTGLIPYPDVKRSKCDIGFKMGTGLDICHHYYVGIHYLAGMLKAWNPAPLGGRNKEWMFTVGYNF